MTTAAMLALGSFFPKLDPGELWQSLSEQVMDQVSVIQSAGEKDSTEESAYTIAAGELAPVPNPANYGTTTNPKRLRRVISKARDLLDGQSLYFSDDVTLFPGSEITYYQDETILAITWKEEIAPPQGYGTSVYTFSEIKIADPSQFRRYLAGDAYDSKVLQTTSHMSSLTNAVVASAGDYYAYRFPGVVVMDGQVMRANPGVPDNCYITKNGDLLMERNQDLDTLQKFVRRKNISFGLSFGPILVQDGKPVSIPHYPMGEISSQFTRAAICQMDSLHYLLIAVNMEPHAWRTINIWEFQEAVAATGCRQAYTIDGGQTATIVMDNRVINQVNYGNERNISDMIYFATALPEDTWQ